MRISPSAMSDDYRRNDLIKKENGLAVEVISDFDILD